ncbi:hypothetical protein NKDENANG_02408 [Candidatus Entotheonellaceae bacterium PAL068K]
MSTTVPHLDAPVHFVNKPNTVEVPSPDQWTAEELTGKDLTGPVVLTFQLTGVACNHLTPSESPLCCYVVRPLLPFVWREGRCFACS